MKYTIKAYTGEDIIYVHPKSEQDLINGLAIASDVDKDLYRLDIYDHEREVAYTLDKIPLPENSRLKDFLVEIEYNAEVKRFPIFE